MTFNPKSDEQVAYNAANAAYQKSWRNNEPLREDLLAAERLLLSVPFDHRSDVTDRLLDKLLEARRILREAEAETQRLLDQREAAYKALIASRGA